MTAQRRVTPRSLQEWGAVLPQWVGLGGLVLMLLFWMATALLGKPLVEPALLTAFGGLLAIGQGAQALVELKTAPPPPLPPPPPVEERPNE